MWRARCGHDGHTSRSSLRSRWFWGCGGHVCPQPGDRSSASYCGPLAGGRRGRHNPRTSDCEGSNGSYDRHDRTVPATLTEAKPIQGENLSATCQEAKSNWRRAIHTAAPAAHSEHPLESEALHLNLLHRLIRVLIRHRHSNLENTVLVRGADLRGIDTLRNRNAARQRSVSELATVNVLFIVDV